MRNIPALDEPFIVGSTFKFLKGPLDFCDHILQQGQGIVSCRIGASRVFVIVSPEYIKYILQDNQANYVRTAAHKLIRDFLGNGLLTSEGESWRYHRKMIQPAFHWDYLKQMARVMTEESVQLGERLQKYDQQTEPFLLSVELMNTTFQIVLRTLLGESKNQHYSGVSESLDSIMRFFYYYTQQWVKLPIGVPLPSHVKYSRAKKNLDRWLFEIIAGQKKKLALDGGAVSHSLLGLLLGARDEETGEGMSDQQLHDEILTLAMAGHETSANALNWAFFLLSEDQDRQNKLRNAINAVWPAEDPYPPSEGPDYLKHVINESMRLYPPAWIFGRQAAADDVIDGYRLPGGSNVIISPYILHRHPGHWESPASFMPERFEDPTRKYHKYALIPFGAGPHFCIGYRFAMLEMQVLIMVLLRKYQFLPSGNPVTPDPFGTLKPKKGLYMKIRALT
jgi:cytochrome P450